MITSLILAGITILLPAESSVRGTEVELGEVATIMGADAPTLIALESLQLTSAPGPGYRRRVDRSMIAGRIRRALPSLDYNFDGRQSTSVFTESLVLDAATIIAAVDAKLGSLRGGRDVTWAPSKKIGSLEVPRGDDGLGLPKLTVEMTDSALLSGTVDVSIRVKINGGTYKTIFASWRIVEWEELPVLTRSLTTGSKVSPALFVMKRVEKPSGKNVNILSAAAMVGAIAAHNLTVGSVVLESDVTRPKVIHSGDQISLTVRKGNISAEVKVIALETAGIGDIIRVKRLTSEIELSAQVITSKTVLLDLGS